MTMDYEKYWVQYRAQQEAAAKAAAEEEARRRQALLDQERAQQWLVYNANQTAVAKKEEEEKKEATVTGYLGENPQAAYSSFLTTLTPDLQNYYKGSYYDLYNEYQGKLADEVKAGVEKQTDFSTFLKGLDMRNRYQGLTNYQKGFYNPNVAPRTRFLTRY